MKQFRIGAKVIGTEESCFVIAEAGINHNGNLATALSLVDAACDAGADAVKFQMRHLPSLYPDELLQNPNLAEWAFQFVLPALKEFELGDEEFRAVERHCQERGIEFMCTPWDHRSLEFLESMGVKAYKVSSADLVNTPLLDAVAATGKPMIISTGMATIHEIEKAVAHLKQIEATFALLHCVSAYPAPFEALNLRYISRLRDFGVPVGYSGHERGISIPVAALALGACIIEKHITLDRTMPGPDHAASLEPHGFKKMVRDLRLVEASLGVPEKHLSQMELLNRHVLRKSVVAARDIIAGETLVAGDLAVSGPGKGLSPQRIEDLVGVTVRRDIRVGDYFCETDLYGNVPELIHRSRLSRPWGLKARFHDLMEVIALDGKLIELHFTEQDVHESLPPGTPRFEQRLMVHAPEFFGRRVVDFASPDLNHRRASRDLIQATIEKARELSANFTGPPTVVVHLGGNSMDREVNRPGFSGGPNA